MSNFSLLTSATQGKGNNARTGDAISPRVLRGLTPPATEGAESARSGMGGGSDDYRLPSGIASLEHWLDLNA
jgi:hypothetical protein